MLLKIQNLKLLSLLLFLSIVSCGEAPTAQITINVKAENVPPDSSVHIAGNKPRMGRWGPRHTPMQKKDSLWTVTLPAEIGSEFSFKVSLGNWRTEAVDSHGVEFPNKAFVVKNDTTINMTALYWKDRHGNDSLISKSRFENKGWSIELLNNWRFKAGDDSTWANPEIDDSDWLVVNTQLRSGNLPSTWEGIGWFRRRLQIDSSIVFFPLSLMINQRGASEVYLDGEKLYTIGQVSAVAENEQELREREPKPLVFARAGEHVLAVRYSNHKEPVLRSPMHWDGFAIWLGHLDNAIESRVNDVRRGSVWQLIFSVIPLSFAVMHILLFIFYPQNKNNLFYAVSMLGFAGMVFIGFQEIFTTIPYSVMWVILIEIICSIIAISFGILAVYSTVYKKMPKTVFLPFLVMSGLAVMLFYFRVSFDLIEIFLYIFLALAILDMSRLTFISRKLNKEWAWISSAGFTAALIIFALQALVGLGVLKSVAGQTIIWMYSIPVIAISLSVYISLNFSKAHKELKIQLDRVQQLSEEKIERERKAQEIEVQRIILEADNARKTKELEEARKLQLSMLPKNVPQVPGIDIAVAMQTATEVGGDYYDFHENGNSALTIAIGDATGHGMRAGTMVASIKSLFSAYQFDKELKATLNNWSEIIRQMNLGTLYMAMSLVHLEKNRIIISNAGMPPALMYRAQNQSVQEIIIKGMPLGGAPDFKYDEKSLSVASGDTLLLMSDGFTELFNQKNDMFDDRAISTFASVAHRSPGEIIQHLIEEGKRWRGERPQHDDITFVVVKYA